MIPIIFCPYYSLIFFVWCPIFVPYIHAKFLIPCPVQFFVPYLFRLIPFICSYSLSHSRSLSLTLSISLVPPFCTLSFFVFGAFRALFYSITFSCVYIRSCLILYVIIFVIWHLSCPFSMLRFVSLFFMYVVCL